MAIKKGQYGIVRHVEDKKTKLMYFSDISETFIDNENEVYDVYGPQLYNINDYSYLGIGRYDRYDFIREFTMQEKLRISELLIKYGCK